MVALLLVACEPQLLLDAGVGEAEVEQVEQVERVLARALELRPCPGDAFGVEGVYVVRFETASTLRGAASQGQPERVTRYGVAQLCGDGQGLAARMLVCDLAFSPVLHEASATCAAEVPGPALVAELPVASFVGEVDLTGSRVALAGWAERWGLLDDAGPPEEPSGAAQVESEDVVDQDQDEAPGVTLRGTGPVPTLSWSARLTEAEFVLQVVRGGLMGATSSATSETILGGPAARLLRGRTREGQEGGAVFVRADGRGGSDRADANADGRLTCGELQPWLGPVLAGPTPVGCD